MVRFLGVFLSFALLLPYVALAADPTTDIMQKIESLSKELEKMKQQLQEVQKKEAAKDERITKVEEKAEKAAGPSWLDIGGDYRARYDNLKGKTQDANVFGRGGIPGKDYSNDALLTNRFGLNLRAKATEDVQVKARLLMYKVWGWDRPSAVTNYETGVYNAFAADKDNIFDANIGHTPQDNTLRVDEVYATWSNIGGAPMWFSIGRRPSTGGIPTNIRQNADMLKTGTGGVPGFMIDWAFDGLTIGYAPDIVLLPGAYAKVCYGKGFDSGFRPNNGLKDVDMLGINAVAYDTDNLHVEVQWNRAFNIFATATHLTTSGTYPNTNIGDVDQYGGVVMGKIDDLGMGDLNLFAASAISKTHPNNNTYYGYGLLWDTTSVEKKSRTGNVIYLGTRYDITSTGTKIGLEYNHGSKYWLAFTPASDDMWTTKLGTRGDVYEAYLIQDINQKPISKKGKAFFRLGYQYYKFNYTGSQNWVGAPYKISDLTLTGPGAAQMFEPLKNAKDIYFTFDVVF